MITRFPGNLAGPTAVTALVACLLGGCAADRPGHVDCSDHDEERVAVLARLPILDARPAATEAVGTFSGCGVDDSGDPVASHADQRYRSTLAESEIRAFYWDELIRDGWRDAATATAPEVAPSLAFQRGISCLIRYVAGTRVRFAISFDPPPGSPAPSGPVEFTIQATDQDVESPPPC